MPRKRDSNLVITIAALSAVGIILAFFNSPTTSLNDSPSIRSKRAALEPVLEEADPEDWGFDQSCDACVSDDECNCDDVDAKAYESDEEPSTRARGRKPVKDVDVESTQAIAALEDRFNKQVNLAEMTNSAGAGVYKTKAYAEPGIDDVSQAVMEHIESLTGVQCNKKLTTSLPQISGTIGSVYIAWPGSISLFGKDKAGLNKQYMEFANSMYDKLQGISSKTKVYAGSHTMAASKFKEVTKRSPVNSASWPLKASMNIGQPQWSLITPSFLKKINPQGQSVNSGNRCFFFWIIHDIARDYRQVIEGSIDFDSFGAQCTIYPIFIKPSAQSAEIADHLIPMMIKGTDANTVVNSDLQGYQIINYDDGEPLFTDAVFDQIFSYMCVVEHNALCRCQTKGWLPKAPKDDKVEAFKEAKEDEPKVTDKPEEDDDEDDGPTTEAPTTSTNDDTTTTRIEFDPIDSCCGRHPFNSEKFDVNTHICCEYVNREPHVGETC